MSNDILKTIIDLNAEQMLREKAEQIRISKGLTDNYELVLSTEAQMLQKNDEVVIIASQRPTIVVSTAFVLECLITKNRNRIRDRLERALEWVPKMTVTLRKPVTMADAIALRTNAKKWVKSCVPQIATTLPSRFFHVTYSVTVKELITNTEITLHGNDIKTLEADAKFRLSRSVIETEEWEDLIDAIRHREDQERSIAKSIPSVVRIQDDNNKVNTKMEY